MRKLWRTLLAIGLFTLAGSVSAGPISGSILFAGNVTLDTPSVTTATIFTFQNPVSVTTATGSFAPLSGGTVTYSPLDLNVGTPITPLWTQTLGLTTYSFDLTAITGDSGMTNAPFRTIKGGGTISITGIGSQSGVWAFTTQNPGAGGLFSFSASTAPEPSIVALLGLGLLGVVAARRFRKSA